jgi:hypothetical protein
VTRLQLLDTTTAAAPPGVFSRWEAAPDEPLSFSAPDDIPVWSVNVSADLTQATAQLEAELAQVTGATDGLSVAEARLAALVENAPGAGLSFDSSATPMPPAERELLATLEQLRAGEPGSVSFGLRPDGAALAEAEEKFKNVLARLTQSLAYYAFVETKIEGHMLCRTTLNWSSDAQTVWQRGLPEEQSDLHRRTLELAVQSRAALMRTVALTAQSALKISTLLALPGGALLALPAAWKFINAVLSEVNPRRAALTS